jgi:hypothetical protein
MQEQQRCNTALATADQCSFCLLFLLFLSLSSDFITTWHLPVAEVRAYMHIPSLGKLLRACVRAVRQRERYFAGLRLTTVAAAASSSESESS